MKKIKTLTSILAILCIGAMTACGNSVNDSSSAKTNLNTTTTTASKSSDGNATDTQTDETTAPTDDNSSGNKTLVAYFSCTGNTKRIAEFVANDTGADLYEIVPAQPYTDEDLDYGNDKSRSTVEMNDSTVRPEISGNVDGWENYDTIFVGYPIWWSEAPRILDTFVESYDFSNKTVIPFVTSGGSGIGSSADTLESLAGGGNWLSGASFSGSEDEGEVADWVSGLGL